LNIDKPEIIQFEEINKDKSTQPQTLAGHWQAHKILHHGRKGKKEHVNK
jgi:hypothetical protein